MIQLIVLKFIMNKDLGMFIMEDNTKTKITLKEIKNNGSKEIFSTL